MINCHLQELAHILAPNWDAIESGYVGNSKQVFRCVRDERERIIKYFYQIRYSTVNLLIAVIPLDYGAGVPLNFMVINFYNGMNVFFVFFLVHRKSYLSYLRRPDHKQEFVSQWQKVSIATILSLAHTKIQLQLL